MRNHKRQFVEGRTYNLYSTPLYQRYQEYHTPTYPQIGRRKETEFQVRYHQNRFYLLKEKKVILDGNGYAKLHVLIKALYWNDEGECLIFLSKDGHMGGIYNLIQEKWILENIKCERVKVVESTKDEWDSYEKKTNIIEFIDFTAKSIMLYSTAKGIIFGPQTFQDIEFCDFGYIINEEFILEYNGYTFNLHGYESISYKNGYEIYLNPENNQYVVLCYERGGGIFKEEDGDDYCLRMNINGDLIVFDKRRKELTIHKDYERANIWSNEDLNEAYKTAFEDDPTAMWNVDDL